ncbi:MAG: sugar ABC transporter ATP-binding protein [Verrucomicrobiales bacterium]
MATIQAATTAPLLEVVNVSKRFWGVRALHEVSLALHPNEVLAVIGENGAGKSTLMKILAGVQKPDSGAIRLRGNDVNLSSVKDAQDCGIALIHQELNLCDNLDIGANVFLGREPRRFGMFNRQQIYSETIPVLNRIGLNYRPQKLVRDLSIGHQQMVEIAKALAANAKILIMDEPTSSLSQHETENLYRIVKELRNSGVSIIYISHRLGEVKELADRVVVLRDGQNAGDLQKEEICRERMVKMMVGRDLNQFYQRKSHAPGEMALEVKGLVTKTYPKQPVSFAIRRGEIVGMAGLVGAGRTELLRVLFGIDKSLAGSIHVNGREALIENPRDAIQEGLALVPEDRKEQGVILEMAVRENLTLASLKRDQKSGFLDRGKENEISACAIKDLNIKTPHDRQVVQYLSGGNQQKVVLGKWLAMKPKALLLDEPTRGIDVGAKQEIYRLMEQLASEGVAILFVSSEMEEILGMSDRVLVLHEGSLTGTLSRAELSEEKIMDLATGGDE